VLQFPDDDQSFLDATVLAGAHPIDGRREMRLSSTEQRPARLQSKILRCAVEQALRATHPLTGSAQGDHQQTDPAVTAAGSLFFYAEIRCLLDFRFSRQPKSRDTPRPIFESEGLKSIERL
jgi:hypothetical protein